MEYFTRCGSNLAIKNQYQLVSVRGYDCHTAFGSLSISSTKPSVYKWYFTIIKQNSMMTIGIACNFKNVKAAFHLDKHTINYAWNIYSGSKVANGNYTKYASKAGAYGDVICMTLNIKKKQLSFSLNNVALGTAFKIKTSSNVFYQLCVAMRGQATDANDKTKNSLQLTKFLVDGIDPTQKGASSSPPKGYDENVVNELVKLGIGTRSECITASKLVVNYRDINAVSDKIISIQNASIKQQHNIPKNNNNMSSFENEIGELLSVINSHLNFMQLQEKSVNAMIKLSGQNRSLLENAKDKALETEKELLNGIMNIATMNIFLNNILLIENLFNSQYTAQQKLKQENARKQYAKNISIYEKQGKPICRTASFVDLLFGAKTDLSEFKKWLKLVDDTCNATQIKLLSNSGAKEKNIERAFYKSFYIYSAMYGKNGHQQMTDVLRCSLVFDTFADLYRCFDVIERLSKAHGGILRCKDRFHPHKMPFGYRDLLINMNCPKSKIPVVCEVQLHHNLFYKHKKISHDMYKQARLFEDKNGVNKAYQYADQYIRDVVGNKLYEYESKEDDNDPHQLLKNWGLEQYASALIDDEGYDDIEYWKDISLEELTNSIKFKTGHAKKFMKKAAAV